MKRLILLAALALTACSDYGTTQEHIDGANRLCAPNGGVQVIKEAHYGAEYESCGYRCSRNTGRTIYRATVECRNGAKFEMAESR